MDLRRLTGLTERLRLRFLEKRDEDDFCALYMCPRTMGHIGGPLEPSEVESRFAARLQLQEQSLLSAPLLDPETYGHASSRPVSAAWPWDYPTNALPKRGVRIVGESVAHGRFVALFGVDRWTSESADWELGAMTSWAHRGNGFAFEGLRALTARMLDAGAVRIAMRCDARNEPACRVAQMCGFEGSPHSQPDQSTMIYWSRAANRTASRPLATFPRQWDTKLTGELSS